jgi:outer membrane autotransporter protein
LDWVDALVIDDTSFTPYVGLSYASTSTDAYTENGGSFPVAYEAVTEHSTIARVGADMVYNLTDDFRVIAKAELAYQFEGTSSQVNGTIVGLNSFSLPAQSQNQFWVRGGIGAEYDIGGGTASVMLNVTSRGQDPDVWIRSNFTMKF